MAAIGEPKIGPTVKWVGWLVSKASVAEVATVAVWLAYAAGQHPTIASWFQYIVIKLVKLLKVGCKYPVYEFFIIEYR